jgi:hypothetical protein
MACQKCASNQSTSCSCHSTSYTVPANAVYGDSTCQTPFETCESVTCTDCVRHCHGEDKWCSDLQILDFGLNSPDGVANTSLTGNFANAVEFCIHKGERLDQIMQKLALAHSDPSAYPYKVKNFYVDTVVGGSMPSIKFIWFEFLTALSGISMQYKLVDSDDWTTVVPFNELINPLTANTFTLTSSMVSLQSGSTYMFKLITTYQDPDTDDDPIEYDPGSVILHVTIP